MSDPENTTDGPPPDPPVASTEGAPAETAGAEPASEPAPEPEPVKTEDLPYLPGFDERAADDVFVRLVRLTFLEGGGEYKLAWTPSGLPREITFPDSTWILQQTVGGHPPTDALYRRLKS